MDAFNDPLVREVVVISSAQVAKTTMLENVLGYYIHHDPAPILVFQPTLEMAETFSKDRLAPMIRDTPALRSRMAEHGSRKGGNTLLHKSFHGGHVTLAGANSEASKHSRPIRIVLFDEVDLYLPGTTIAAGKRTTAFWNSKKGFWGTPKKSATSELQRRYDDSDQRKRFVPCPHCTAMHVLLWENLKWTEGAPIPGKDGRLMRRAVDAWFECPECRGEIRDVARWRAIKLGEWRATAPFHGVAGFWLWQGYSPFVKAVDTANEWLSALGRPADLERVMNEVRGEPWQETGEAPEWEILKARAGGYKRGTVPVGGLFITSGADVQKDRIEVSHWAWGRGRSSWLVDHVVLKGDTSRPDVWQLLDTEIARSFPHEMGPHINISLTAVDAAYETQAVYDFSRRHGTQRVIPYFGKDSGQALCWLGNAVDVMNGGRKIRRGLRPYLINVSMAKSELYGLLGRKESDDAPGTVHFPEGMEDEYFQQMVSEHLVSKTVKGYLRREWQKLRERNESLDCRNAARGAAEHYGISRFSERGWRALEAIFVPMKPSPDEVRKTHDEEIVVAAQPPKSSSPPRDSWISSGSTRNWFNR